jgi:hypothetical protein
MQLALNGVFQDDSELAVKLVEGVDSGDLQALVLVRTEI